MQRRSKKRDAIYEVLSHDKSHPTAEEIYTAAKELEPDLSLGTVYRNLLAFEKEGMVNCVAKTGEHSRFDAVLEPHDHFVCSRCGCIIDAKRSDDVDELIKQLSKELNTRIDSITFNGLCIDCFENNESKKSN